MAEYADDSGLYEYDALLSVGCVSDATNYNVYIPDGDDLDTGFVLPQEEAWWMFETYNVADTAKDIGHTNWDSDVSGTMLTKMTDYRDNLIGTGDDYEGVNVEFAGTYHYKDGSDWVCDVYRGDETTQITLASEDTGLVINYPAANWKITNEVLAPSANLLLNGDFSDGPTSEPITNWDSYASILTIVAKDGHARCLQVADDGSWSSGLQSFLVSDGDEYELSFDYINESTDTGNGYIAVGTDMGSDETYLGVGSYTTATEMSGFESQTKPFTITATGTIYIKCHSDDALTAWFDNVKLIKTN